MVVPGALLWGLGITGFCLLLLALVLLVALINMGHLESRREEG